MSSVSDDYRKAAATLSKDQAVHYKELGSAWAAANGFVVMRPTGLQVAPCSLTPSPFPSKVYKQCKDLIPDFGKLVHAVSKDHDFINQHLAPVAESDDFQKKLLDIYNSVREEGVRQPISLAILRSDYMLHDNGDASPLQPRQVEINTIASSFAALSEKATLLHSFLLSRSPVPPLDPKNCPPNAPIDNIASGIAQASKLYEKAEPPATGGAGGRKIGVLFVVQPDEGNVFDQRHLEFRIFDKHSIPVIRATLAEIESESTLDEGSRRLMLRGFEISVIYFRAGYAPTDYFGDSEWSARLKMERSAAVKCPTAAYQCVGAKKIQQVLAAAGETERFVDKATAKRIRASYAGLYPLGDGSEEAAKAKARAIENPDKYVLKPQREGGGNNLYDQDMKQALETMSDHELQAFILMDIIQAPQSPAVFMRDGQMVECDGIAELGTYGVSISNGNKLQRNDYAGHLLRSKMASSKEAGVAAGFGVIDSPYLY
eukprot:CAMPEP_0173448260 /NCGR_PEP_ID=MMETSP1357-20121228/40390_1 /TAXON_ID=77926 /ORGANISM="Hemiselmis rufescens, Strain PCC563" /LENGTH=486 /DNA_ID=CAMNT_0014414751 /DNA_START=163 /DNA_END=1623 /DNA_ORIENTATION=+